LYITFCQINLIAQCSISLTSSNVTCKEFCNGSATLSSVIGSSPYTYSWQTGGTGLTVSNLCVGTYSVTLTDHAGCKASSSVTITGLNELAATNNVIPTKCYGSCNGQAVLIPSGGVLPYNTLWSTGSTNLVVTNLCAGNISVTITDDNGCHFDTTLTVIQPDSIFATMGSTPANCPKSNGSATVLTITGGMGNYTYNWCSTANFQVSANAIDLAEGNYTVTITDRNGCLDTGKVEVGCVTGVDEFDNKIDFKLFPNPSSKYVTFQITTFQSDPIQVSLCNFLGQTILSSGQLPYSTLYSFDVSDLPKAIYIIEVWDLNTGAIGRQKIVVQ